MDFLRRPTPSWYERSMFEPRWNQPKRQEIFNPWSRQPRRQVFIDPEDYYDPLFGGKQQQQCNCRKCAKKAAYNKQQQSVADDETPLRLVRKKKNKPFDRHSNDQKQNDESVNDGLLERQQGDAEPEEESYLREENIEEMKQIENDVLSSTTTEDDSSEKDIKKITDPIILQKINNINKIKSDVELLCEKVNNISFQSKEYEYLYCEEMLTKCLLKLDDILAEGEESIRKARKELVLKINKALLELEQNRDSNEENDESSEDSEETQSEVDEQ